MSTQQEIPPLPIGYDGVGEVEDRILADLTARLDGSLVEELTEGGSPARLQRVELPGGAHVIKLLVDHPGAVDGHDLGSFHVKIRQIEKVRRERAVLGDVYTELSHEFYGDNWAAYTMPFYPNHDIAQPLREDEDPRHRYVPQVRTILLDLVGRGYLSERVPAPPGNIAEVHADRLIRRFRLLREYLPAELTDAERIVVNGVPCRNPLRLAETIVADPSLTAGIDPVHLHYPVHGDLNTRNILVTDEARLAGGDGGYRIIDPRGTLDPWDTAYDLSKILFSFSVWDAGLRKGFALGSVPGGEWTVGIRGGNYPNYVTAAHGLLPLLRSLPGFDELTGQDPGWESRYLLGHAFHLLAEAACRLSDIKKRTNENDSFQLSPIELATGHYLYGVLFLEDAVARLQRDGRVDHDAALAHLT
ncbi:hypothetical protein FAF44_12960 [Nonomuraea sp. MG754425]|uniref:hypothetical protein n=1 Tax=Nonomuraea sp. MG754425 TaxID=2570319 RepID=UPI001F2D9033|nr:hypothetical protein [Nonomuraea sp. MG754425]MCF6469296.1 hypothetical protein [Nonomuraea sp. MG754425]